MFSFYRYLILIIYFLLSSPILCFSADHELAFPITIKHEGHAFTSFHYDFDGGGTRFGISYNTFKRVVKQKGLKPYDNDKDKKISLNDLRLLTMAQAKGLYKGFYWDVVGGDYIKNQLTAELLYDYLIHGGLSIKKLQILLKMKKVDGILGKETIKAINSSNICSFNKKILESRKRWLFEVMPKSRPQTFKNCKRGWANRLNYYVQQINKQCNEKLQIIRV